MTAAREHRETGPVILVADDDASVRAYVRHVLSRRGYTTLEAANGCEALHIIRDRGETVDLLVTDENMPNMRGTDLAKTVRRANETLPILFISACFNRDTERFVARHPNVLKLDKFLMFRDLEKMVHDMTARSHDEMHVLCASAS